MTIIVCCRIEVGRRVCYAETKEGEALFVLLGHGRAYWNLMSLVLSYQKRQVKALFVIS
jgi:hypothetical protein